MLVSNRFNNKIVTVTLQLLKMTLESVETSSKSFIIIINFIVKSIIILLLLLQDLKFKLVLFLL